MTAQNEPRWALRAIKANWPDPSFRSDIRRIDREEPEVLETGQRRRSIDLAGQIAVGAAEASQTREPRGTEHDYRVETELEVSVEAVHASEHGAVGSAAEFRTVAAKVERALNAVRRYPEVDPDADSIGRVSYHTLTVDSAEPALSQTADYYRRVLSVRLVGVADLP